MGKKHKTLNRLAMKRIVIVGSDKEKCRKIASTLASKGWQVALAAPKDESDGGNIVCKDISVTAQDAVARFNDLIEENNGMDVLLLALDVCNPNPLLQWGSDEPVIANNVRGFTRIINAAYLYYKATANEGAGMIWVAKNAKNMTQSVAYDASMQYQKSYIKGLQQLADKQCVNIKIRTI